MKTLLVIICTCTILATAYLSLSLAIWRPPHAHYLRWSLMATVFAAQSVLTLVMLAGSLTGAGVRRLLLTGALAIIVVGALWVISTVSGPHFEGYALVLGSALVIQGALTLGVSLRSGGFSAAG